MRDDESGLYYNWHRYYGPTIGRYYQADPLGLYSGDYNLYRYADGNPTRYTDPDGCAVPLLLAAYGIYELGSTLFDIWTATTTILDDCASDEEREFALGGLVAGALLPGGGYGSAGKALVKDIWRLERHHMIPKQFAAEAARAGIDIENWVKAVPLWKHRLVAAGVHAGPNNYNKAWKQFFRSHRSPSGYEVLNQMYRLNRYYSLQRFRWVK